MEYKEIKQLLDKLSELTGVREEILYENGGEFTDEVNEIEQEIRTIASNLLNEGIDDLGRWLYSLQAKEDMLKAESASISAKRRANTATIDFVLGIIDMILISTGRAEAKGKLYSFKEQVSTTVVSDDEAIRNKYLQIAEKAIRDAGVPDYIKLSLSGNVTAAKQLDDIPEFFKLTMRPRAKFTKPRKSSE